jgi:hypothetical protein
VLVVANKPAARAAKRQGGMSGGYSRRAGALLAQRDEQVTTITMLRSGSGAPSPFLRKAETLLTRYWARSDWQAREEILRTVQWLLSMAKLQSATSTAAALPAPRVKRRSRTLAPA